MRMNIGIGRFCLNENATRNPQLFLKFTFFVGGAGGYNKGRLTFGEPAFAVYAC